MRRMSYLLFGLALFGLTQLPAFGQAKNDDLKVTPPMRKIEPTNPPQLVPLPAPGPSYRHLDGRSLVIVANGVSGSTTASDNLIELNGELNLGLRIQAVSWTRTDSLYGDLIDHEAQMNAAMKIACLTQAIRRDCPHSRIFFVGSSAGARVVLTAAEMSPAKSIDRIILLSPAVSSTHDLTAALRASRCGIDNFWASEDNVLARAAEYLSVQEKTPVYMAGRAGFRLPCPTPEYKAAYCNVRQYRWHEELCGNGGHHCWLIEHNMKKCVLPLFFMSCPVEMPIFAPPPLPAIKNFPPVPSPTK